MTEIHPGQFRLSRIQLVNWGTFEGATDVRVAREGFLLTGASGSGKSTLIDAISAVLLPGDRIRFNAAAQTTATRGKGRSLVSYIRGAWRSREDHASGDIGQIFLRNGATFSILALTYDNADGEAHTLIALFYLRAGATANADISRLYGVVTGDVDALDLAPYLNRGVDKRKIKADFPAGMFSEKHSVFADRFRTRLGIANEEAQYLLQRAQSAKDLQSLDTLFRDYMLPRPNTFEDADRAVENFHDLENAYERVEDIRAQVATLEPLVKLNTTKSSAVEEKLHLEELVDALPTIRDRIKRQEAEVLVNQYSIELDQATSALASAVTSAKQAEELRRIAEDRLNTKLGPRRNELAMRLENAQEHLERTEAAFADLTAAVTKLGGTAPSSTEQFNTLVESARIIVTDAPGRLEELSTESEQHVEDRTRLGDTRKELARELESLAGNRSNIEARLTDVRARLVQELGLSRRDLVFAGELIDVTDEPWEPVIQRLLARLGATLLVPASTLSRVRAWINSHNLNALLHVNGIDFSAEHSTRRLTGRDSLPRKVTVIDSPFKGWLDQEISRRFDYRCVETPEELDALKDSEHGVTIDGLVRYPVAKEDRTTTRLSKDDRRTLGDRSTYRLGSTNDLKIESIRAELRALDTRHAAAVNLLRETGAQMDHVRHELAASEGILQTTWTSVDVASAQAHVARLREEVAALRTDPEAEELEQGLVLATRQAELAEDARTTALTDRAIAGNKRDLAQGDLDKLNAKKEIEVSAEIAAQLERLLKESTRRVHAGNVDDKTDELRQDFETRVRRHTQTISSADTKITETLATYLQRWPSEQADMVARPEFIGEGLTRLAVLKDERLAEFKARFLNLINKMSTHNLGHVARALRGALREIQNGVEPINESLARSDFNSGTHLRIDVRDNRGQPVIDFQRDLDAAISGGLSASDEDVAMKRYQAIAKIISRLSSQDAADQRWRSLVLDTRRHVRFIGIELDEAETPVNTYVDSSSLSGGQAQKLVFFCLAAALRYQLAEPGAQYPSYATVVLDEAFDRADPSFTRQTMDVFRQFGFHMVLATPLKLIQTLGDYVGGTLVVTYSEDPDAGGEVRGRSRVSRIELEKR